MRKWAKVSGPPVSLARLTLMLTTLGQQIAFMISQDIFSTTGLCHKCGLTIPGEAKTCGNKVYWDCTKCKARTSNRFGSVLYRCKMRLNNWILLAYCFTERNRTYAQTINEASLPMEGYQDRTLSSRTVLRWFRFFRSLCRKDYWENKVKIGGAGTIIEGDESMFGKMKFGKGFSVNRRRAWVFGMVCRLTGRLFLYVCPQDEAGKYKRTKKALYPMILGNVVLGSSLYTDGWRAYRRLPQLGYRHTWINHDLHFCDPTDETINTNMIEGAWRQVKKWLPQSGPYNLQEYLDLFLWFHEQKIAGKKPFWRLMELVAANNSYEAVEAAQGDMEANVFGERFEEDKDDKDEEEEEYVSDAETDHYWYDCLYCKEIWLEEERRDVHMITCKERL